MADEAPRAPAGGVRFRGKTYKQGDRLPQRYYRHHETARPRDPAATVAGMPANFGRSILPHVYTFSGLTSSLAKVYMPNDEALRHSQTNAHMMLNDPMVSGPLFARQMMVSLLNGSVESEDDKNPRLKAVADDINRQLTRMKRFTEYKRCLSEAIWYGRYAAQHRFGIWTAADGKKRQVITDWEPVSGDKLVYRYNDGRYEETPGQLGVKVSRSYLVDDPLAGAYNLEPSGQGMIYFLQPWERSKFAVHQHMIRDGEYEDPLSAGSIHGVGLRSFLYWVWYQKQETLAQMVELIERTGSGITIYYYPSGDNAAREKIDIIAAQHGHTNIIKLPTEFDNPDAYRVEQLPPNTAGLDALSALIDDHFGDQITRFILGQTLSTKTSATGMNSGVADLQGDSLTNVVGYDAVNLEETITTQAVNVLRDLNHPQYRSVDFRYRISTSSAGHDDKMGDILQAWNMGAELRESDVMDRLGLSTPKKGERTLVNPQIKQAIMQMNNPQPMPGMPGAPPPGGPGAPPAAGPSPDDGDGGGDDPGGPGEPDPNGKGPDVSKLFGPLLNAKLKYEKKPRLREAIEQAAAQVDREPSEAQIAAGNARMGSFWWKGWEITIETPKGHNRRPEWPAMPAHYGYLRRTEGRDGDHVDVFVGPEPESELVYVVDQVKASGRFDEHKVLIGFPCQAEAVDAYKAAYPSGWKVGPVTAMTVGQFRAWLLNGNTTKPINQQVSQYAKRTAHDAEAQQLYARKRGTPAAGSFDWDEDKHPRADDGKFSHTPGAGASHGGTAEQVDGKGFLSGDEVKGGKKDAGGGGMKTKQTGFLLGQYDDPDQGLLFGDAAKKEAKAPTVEETVEDVDPVTEGLGKSFENGLHPPKEPDHVELGRVAWEHGGTKADSVRHAITQAGHDANDWRLQTRVAKEYDKHREGGAKPAEPKAVEKEPAKDHPEKPKPPEWDGRAREPVEVKEPWQMTEAEYNKARGERRYEAIVKAIDSDGGLQHTTMTTQYNLDSPDHVRLTKGGEVQLLERGKWVSLGDEGEARLAARAGLKPEPSHFEHVQTALEEGRPVPEEAIAAHDKILHPEKYDLPDAYYHENLEDGRGYYRQHDPDVREDTEITHGHVAAYLNSDNPPTAAEEKSLRTLADLNEKHGKTPTAEHPLASESDKEPRPSGEVGADDSGDTLGEPGGKEPWHTTIKDYSDGALLPAELYHGLHNANDEDSGFRVDVKKREDGKYDVALQSDQHDHLRSPYATGVDADLARNAAWRAAGFSPQDYPYAWSKVINNHRQMVKDAIAAGHDVPEAVLAEYPELKPRPKKEDEDVEKYSKPGQPHRYAIRHAPVGGVTIAGKKFTGGQFIPEGDYEKADPATKAAIDKQTGTKEDNAPTHALDRIAALPVGHKLTAPDGETWTKGKNGWQDASGKANNGRGVIPAQLGAQFGGPEGLHKAIDASHPKEATAPEKSDADAWREQNTADIKEQLADPETTPERRKELEGYLAENELTPPAPRPTVGQPGQPPAAATAQPAGDDDSSTWGARLDALPDGSKVSSFTKKGGAWHHPLGTVFSSAQLVKHAGEKVNGFSDALAATETEHERTQGDEKARHDLLESAPAGLKGRGVERVTTPAGNFWKIGNDLFTSKQLIEKHPATAQTLAAAISKTKPADGAGQPLQPTGQEGGKSPAPAGGRSVDWSKMAKADQHALNRVATMFGINPGDAQSAQRASNFALLAARKLGLNTETGGTDKLAQVAHAVRFLEQQQPKLESVIDTARQLGYKGNAQTLVQKAKGASDHLIKKAVEAGYQSNGQLDKDDLTGALQHLATRTPETPPGPGAPPGGPGKPPKPGETKPKPEDTPNVRDIMAELVKQCGGWSNLGIAAAVIGGLWFAFTMQQRSQFFAKGEEGGFNVLRYEEPGA